MSLPAYIDPGTGSVVTQLAVAGAAGVAVAVRLGWRKTTGRFRRLREPAGPDEAPQPDDDS